jgi:hypothetical protein
MNIQRSLLAFTSVLHAQRGPLLAAVLMGCLMMASAQSSAQVQAEKQTVASSASTSQAETMPGTTSSEETQGPESPDIANGQATQGWLSAQAGRKQASRTRQTLSGPVMSKVHERYLESFKRAIPDRLRDETNFGTKK